MTQLNQDVGPRVVPATTVGAGSLVSPPNYPPAPYNDAPISHDPEQGIPRDVNTFAMGMQIMARCQNCGLAVPPDELGEHNQDEGFASDFGVREWSL